LSFYYFIKCVILISILFCANFVFYFEKWAILISLFYLLRNFGTLFWKI
jgi:hypothetical protein